MVMNKVFTLKWILPIFVLNKMHIFWLKPMILSDKFMIDFTFYMFLRVLKIVENIDFEVNFGTKSLMQSET